MIRNRGSRKINQESLEQLRVLEFGKKIYVIVTEKKSYGVDTAEDIKKILKRL